MPTRGWSDKVVQDHSMVFTNSPLPSRYKEQDAPWLTRKQIECMWWSLETGGGMQPSVIGNQVESVTSQHSSRAESTTTTGLGGAVKPWTRFGGSAPCSRTRCNSIIKGGTSWLRDNWRYKNSWFHSSAMNLPLVRFYLTCMPKSYKKPVIG